MKMKKVVRMLGLCALVALAITSCKKNEEQSKQLTILATINQPVAEGRTHIGPDNMLVWDAGNSIKVFNANGAKGDFTTQAQDEWDHAPFTGTLTPTDTYTAFYPNAVVDGTNVKINLNATQNYVNNNFGNDTYPMYATGVTNGNNIEFGFDSHASVLRLQFKSNNNCRVGSIIVTGNTGDVYAGNLVYAYNDPSTCTVENGTNEVTLNCGNGVNLIAGTPTDFNIVLKSGTLTTGTKVTVKDLGGNVIKEFTTSQSNPLNPRHILIMGEQEVVYNLPSVTTNEASSVSYTTATLNGEYTEIPGAAVTSCGFYFSENEADVQNKVPSAKVSCASVGSPMSYPVSGLTAGTTYYFRAWAANSTGENCGQVLSFTTPVQVVSPNVVTDEATVILKLSAQMNGHVESVPNLAPISQRGFDWGLSASALTNHVNLGNGGLVFNSMLNGLTAGTTYWYRAYAISEGTTYYGDPVSFTTQVHTIGAFSVSPTKRVTFSPGNLWFDGQKFCFESEQTGHHENNGAVRGYFTASGYNPSNPSGNNYGMAPYNVPTNEPYTFMDWGDNAIYNPETNSMDAAGTWTTITADEFYFMLCGNQTYPGASEPSGWEYANCGYINPAPNVQDPTGIRYADQSGLKVVNGVKCLVIMPDSWHPNTAEYPYSIATASWQELEADGGFFLPASGWYNTQIPECPLTQYNNMLAYWTGTINYKPDHHSWVSGYITWRMEYDGVDQMLRGAQWDFMSTVRLCKVVD